MAILIQRKKCYHAISKRTAGMRVELAKKGLNMENKEEKRNSQHR